MKNSYPSSIYVLGGLAIAAWLLKSKSPGSHRALDSENKQLSPEDLKELHEQVPDFSSDPTSAYSTNPSPS